MHAPHELIPNHFSVDFKRIPPSERYSQHQSKIEPPRLLIDVAVSRCGLDPRKTSVEALYGGFQNANFLLRQDRAKFVVRFYSASIETMKREVGVMRFLREKEITVPKIVDAFEIDGKGVAVLEYLPGILLQNVLLKPHDIDSRLFHSIGEELAKVHLIRLPHAGFIGAEMTIGNEFDNFSLFLRGYIERVLRAVDPSRLDFSVRDRLLRLIDQRWTDVLQTEPSPQLVHCDFNPKNILINAPGSSQLCGILDWEFCLSGNGLGDFGNFFRFPFDYPEGAAKSFIDGYKSVNPALSDNWLEASILMDLGNMCSFLERRENYQNTFRTARHVIDRTLKHFNY